MKFQSAIIRTHNDKELFILKKIVYFSHGLSANGIETFLVNVLEKLDKTKYDATVVIAIDEGVECLHEQRVLDMGVKVVRMGDLDSVLKKLAYYMRVKDFLKKSDFDIAHSNMDLLNGITLSLAKKAGIEKRICHAHTSKSQFQAQGIVAKVIMSVQKEYHSRMKDLILSCSTDRVACSSVAGEYFYGDKDYELVYNGIDISIYEQAKSDEELKQEIGICDVDKNIIVSVGRLTPVKNPTFALEVMAELKKIRNDFRYLWVGDGELKEEVETKIAELGLEDTVILTGVRTDIPQILACCDCFLMPSLFEGLPFSLVEAQAAGLKCVVSDVVTKTADIGLVDYFSLEKSAKEWAEEINRVLQSPKKEKNKEKAKLFDISHTVSQLEKIYEK